MMGVEVMSFWGENTGGEMKITKVCLFGRGQSISRRDRRTLAAEVLHSSACSHTDCTHIISGVRAQASQDNDLSRLCLRGALEWENLSPLTT